MIAIDQCRSLVYNAACACDSVPERSGRFAHMAKAADNLVDAEPAVGNHGARGPAHHLQAGDHRPTGFGCSPDRLSPARVFRAPSR